MIPELDKLTEIIAAFPGIGKKSALRIALYLVEMDKSQLESIVTNIGDLAKSIKNCEVCHVLTLDPICRKCNAPYGEAGVLCVVESVTDVYKVANLLPKGSKFHVLGGKLSPLNGVTPQDLNIDSLIKRSNEDGLKEILIAIGSDVEGETTANYLLDSLASLEVKKTRLAFGVSVGGSIGSADERSIQKSISDRISC